MIVLKDIKNYGGHFVLVLYDNEYDNLIYYDSLGERIP